MKSFRSIFFVSILVTLPFFLFGQIPAFKTKKTYGGSGAERIYSIYPCIDSGYIFSGITNSYIGDGDLMDSFRVKENRKQVDPYNDFWIVKLDKNLKIEWERVLGGSQSDVATSVVQTSDSNYVAAGYSYSNDGDMPLPHLCDSITPLCKDAWAMKFNRRGEILWKKNLGGSGDDNINALQPTKDGGCVLIGFTDSNDGDIPKKLYHDSIPFLDTGGDAWIIKLDTAGNIAWQKLFGGSAKDEFMAIQPTRDSNFIVGGYTNSVDGDLKNKKFIYSREAWLIKFDTAFNILWQTVTGKDTGNIDSRAYAVTETKKGDFVIAGNSAMGTALPLLNDYFIAKFDKNGKRKWAQTYGGSDDEIARNVVSLDGDDGVIVGGYTFSSDGDVVNYRGARDGWLIRLDSMGRKNTTRTVGGSDFDYIFTSLKSKKGTYIFGGYTKSRDGDVVPLHNELDAWLFELNSETNCDSFPKPSIKIVQDTFVASSAKIFKWYLNDTLIANAQKQIFVPNKTGYYKVVTSDSAFCSASSDSIFWKAKPVYACPSLNKNIGDTCTDNNPLTRNDTIRTDCTCKGTLTATQDIFSGNEIILRDIFPNPTTDKFIVSIYSPRISKIEMKLYNTIGKLIDVKTLTLSEGENKFSYESLEDTDSGIYFLILNSAEKNIGSKKVIKF